MKTSEKIAEMLKRKGLSQEELAILIGVRQPRISKWIGGEGSPNPHQLLRIARTFGVSMEYLADPELEEPSSPGLSEDERYLLRTWRNLGISADLAGQRMSGLAVDKLSPDDPRNVPPKGPGYSH